MQLRYFLALIKLRSRHLRCSIKKVLLKNFKLFTGKYLCLSLFFFESRVFIVRANQVRASWEAKGGETNQVRSTKIYFDIFIETMFAFLHHLLIENFKPESYCFERNSRIWRLNDYHFKLYKQHDGTFRGFQINLKNWNCRLLREEKLTVVKLQLQSFSRVTLGPAFPILGSHYYRVAPLFRFFEVPTEVPGFRFF